MSVLRWCGRSACLVALLMAGTLLAGDTADESQLATAQSEDAIESAMLYNFTRFIEWPEGTLGQSGSSVVVGVLEDDRVAPLLAAALRDKTIHGHPVVVRRLGSAMEAKSCAVLFVGTWDRKKIARIVQAVGRSPVLTVGEREQFSRLGGVVAFIRDGSRIQFEINLDAANRAGLQVSSKLLRLATVWREPPPQARN